MGAALAGYEAGRAQGRTEAGHGTLAARAETLYTEALVWLNTMSATISFASQPAATPGEPNQICTITLRDYYLSATGYEFLSTAQALKSLWEAADR